MLDRIKLLKSLRAVQDELFCSDRVDVSTLASIWARMCADPLVAHNVHSSDSITIPDWTGSLGSVYAIPDNVSAYHVISTDGSQIYPDRHEGVSCYLINIGTVELHYGCCSPAVHLNSEPFVYVSDGQQVGAVTPDMVNGRRQEMEFELGMQTASEMQRTDETVPLLFLCDGSLIFWHLKSPESQIQQQFISSYIASFEYAYQHRLLMAGYVSAPRSQELVQLVRSYAQTMMPHDEVEQLCTRIVDTTIASCYLDPYHRTTVFKNNASISKRYPHHLAPHFFYLNVGHEIARVEIPAWVADTDTAIEHVSTMIIDQARKGFGYPVAIAESHEQAVVKGPDRELFYQLIGKMAVEQNRRILPSQKSQKKRRMVI